MGAGDGAQEQVVEHSHSLRCAVCGAGNRLSTGARSHGWFRCAHCGAGAPVPGVWTLPSWARGHPLRLPLQVRLFVALQGLLLTLVWVPALAVPVMKPFALSVAAAWPVALAYMVGVWLRWTFGRERFDLDASVLQHTVQVGPWSSRPVRIPLVRILEVEGYDWMERS